MKVIVQNKRDITITITYNGVLSIVKQHFDDTGKQWVLLFEHRQATDPTPPASATFGVDEWDIFCEHNW